MPSTSSFTPRTHWIRPLTNNATGASFPSIVDVATARAETDAPGAANILVIEPHDNVMMLAPFGTGVDDTEGAIRIYGESGILSSAGQQHHPVFLVEVNVRLSAAVGLAGGLVLNTERYADHVAFVAGDNGGDFFTFPANQPGYFVIDHRGFGRIIVVFNNTDFGGGVATTDLNALVRTY